MDNLIQFIAIALGSSGFMSLIQYLITRRDKKAKQLDEMEKDLARTQLLVLMADYPEKKDEIIEVAHKYFVALKGNWVYGTIFASFCKENGIEVPDWVK